MSKSSQNENESVAEKSILELAAEADRQHRLAATARKMAAKKFARGRWPITPDAMGVAPEQCEEAEQKMRERGVNVQYDRTTGCPIITSEGQYKKMRRIAGLRHRGSYSE